MSSLENIFFNFIYQCIVFRREFIYFVYCFFILVVCGVRSGVQLFCILFFCFSWGWCSDEFCNFVFLFQLFVVFGREFSNFVGLVVGFDKDGEGVRGLIKIGFGFIEIGSVILEFQFGNFKLRVFRFKEDKVVINR